jgi:hypothetical protein
MNYEPGFYWHLNGTLWEVLEVTESGEIYECGNEVSLRAFGMEYPPGSLIKIPEPPSESMTNVSKP